MNLATAYPDEAGIAQWNRSIFLERNEGCVRLTEDFKLQQRVPVALTFMTPRIPAQGAQGTVVLSLADKSGSDVSLKFDPALAVTTFEKIPLKDPDLRRIWGENIYRVLLTSTEPTSAGTWKIEIV